MSCSHSDGISQHAWEVEGHDMLVCSPAQLVDIVIPKPLRNDMCLWNLKQLDRAQQLFQEGMSNYKRLMSDPFLAGSFGSYKKARLASEAHTRLRLPSHWLQHHPLLTTKMWHTAMRGDYSLQYIYVTQACKACVKTYIQVSGHIYRWSYMSGTHTIWVRGCRSCAKC